MDFSPLLKDEKHCFASGEVKVIDIVVKRSYC
jgi:hypothetical protein